MNTYAILQAMTTGHAEHVHTRNRVHTYRGEGIELRYHGRTKIVTLHKEGDPETYATIDDRGVLTLAHIRDRTPAGILAAVARAGYSPDTYGNPEPVPAETEAAAERAAPSPDYAPPQTVDVYGTPVQLTEIDDTHPARLCSHKQWRVDHAGRWFGYVCKSPTGWYGVSPDRHRDREQPTRRDALSRLLVWEPYQPPAPAIEEPAGPPPPFPQLDHNRRRLTGTREEWRALAAACAQSRQLFNAQTEGQRAKTCAYLAELAAEAPSGTYTEEAPNASVWFDYLAAIHDRTGYDPERIRAEYGKEEPVEHHAPAIDPAASQEEEPQTMRATRDYTITKDGAVIAEVSHVDATTKEPEPMQTETARATVNARELARALAVLRPAIARKTALPVLSTVRLTVHPQTLTVTADNLELRISQHLAAETAGAFDVCADYAFVAALLKGVKATTRATIEYQPARTAVSDPKTEPGLSPQLAVRIDGAVTYVRDLIPAEEFPVMLTSNTAEPIAIDAPELMRILARVEKSAATNDSRPVLAGIVLRHDQQRGRLTAAAADGFTLSTADTAAPDGADALHDTIMPARAARAMLAAKLPAECYLTPTTNRSALHLAYDGGAITTRLIDGTFPDYKQIIPREFQTQITLDGPAFYAALQAAGRVARDNNDVCRFDTHTMNGTLDVHATAAERGNVNTPVPTIEHTEPTDKPVAFNWKYLATAYEVMQKPARVRLSLNGPNQAGMMSDPAGNGLTVIMPMVIGAN